MKLNLLSKLPQLKSLSHNLCHFSGHGQTSFLLLHSQKSKATSIRKCLQVFLRSYADLTQMWAFFLDLFVYLLRCLIISLYWDVSCVWAQYIYLESEESTMPIEPCHVFARWGVTLVSCGYLPVNPNPTPRPAYHGHLTRGLLRSVGILTQRRHARSGIWRSCQNACQRRKQKDFVILSAFSMCNAFTGHCTYIHCFVGAFERFWKSPLNEGFLEWTVFWNEQTTIR